MKKRIAARTRSNTRPSPAEQGLILFRQGDYRAALQAWEKAPAPPALRAEAFFRLGLAQQAAGKTRAALGSWQKAINLRPDRATYHFYHGLAAHLLDEPARAAAAYRQALRLQPGADRILYHLGLVLVLQDGEEAFAWLEGPGRDLSPARRRLLFTAALIKAGREPGPPDPADPAGTRLLFALRAQPEEAVKFIDEALALEPENPAAWRLLALVRAARGDPGSDTALQKALDLGGRREELVPRVTELKKSFLNRLMAEGRLEQAAEFLARDDRIAPIDPGREKLALVLALQGNALARAEDWPRAADCWRRAIALGRRDPRLWQNLALAYELLDQPGEAASCWRRTIDAWSASRGDGQDRAPFLACAYRHLAELEAGRGRYREYVTDLELAAKYAPTDVQIRLDLARALAEGDEDDRCRSVLEEILQLAPDNPDVISGLARYYLARNEWQKAGPLLEHGMKVASDDPGVRKCMTNYCLAQARSPDHRVAGRWLHRALETAPERSLERAPILVHLAVLAYLSKNWREWHRYMEEAQSLDPGDRVVHLLAAGLFFAYDRPGAAQKQIRLALACAPDDPDTYLTAANLYLEYDRPDDAVTCLRRALELDQGLKTFNKAADLCIEHRQWELARSILTAARQAFPDQPDIVIDLAGTLLQLHRYQEAYRTLLELKDYREHGFDPEASSSFKAIKQILEEELFD